jgi:hypothetical protein
MACRKRDDQIDIVSRSYKNVRHYRQAGRGLVTEASDDALNLGIGLDGSGDRFKATRSCRIFGLQPTTAL